MVSNPYYHYYHLPHFDLKSWTIDNISTKKCKWKHAKEVINYLLCNFVRDLNGNNCTRPSLDRHKCDSGRVLCIVLVTIPWAEPPSLIKFHSIDNECIWLKLFLPPAAKWGGGTLSRGGVSVRGSLCPEGLCPGDPPYGNVRAVRILLECILVFVM